MGARAEHQHREPDTAQHRKGLRRRIDHTEPGAAEHEAREELADHHGDQAAPAEGEQRSGDSREHEDRQLYEHREIMPRTPPLVSVVEATRSYERWVGRQVPMVRADLAFKHEQMAVAPFPFLRATFYRWAQQWESCCGDLAAAPRVLAVGDLHTQNFGTWRDQEGRLIWGINDFDEAFPMAYTNDLVRLATSARLSIAAGTMQISAACRMRRNPRRVPLGHRHRRPAVCARGGASGPPW